MSHRVRKGRTDTLLTRGAPQDRRPVKIIYKPSSLLRQALGAAFRRGDVPAVKRLTRRALHELAR